MASNDIQVTLSASDKTSAAFASAKRNIAGLSTSAAGLTRTLGLAIPALTGAGFIGMAKGAIDAADALNDMSQRTGVAVKDLASLRTAAEQNGTSLEDVGKAVAKLNLSFSQAQGGAKEQADALKRLGITSADARERFFQLADAYAKAGDKTSVLADVQKVLGKSYQEMIPLLAQGGDELRKAAQASESFADAMARLAPEADKFNDEMARLKTEAAGGAAVIVTDLMPAFKALGVVALGVTEIFSEVGASIGASAAAAVAVSRGKFTEAAQIMASLFEDLDSRQGAFKKRVGEMMSAAKAVSPKSGGAAGAADFSASSRGTRSARATADPLASLLAGTEVAKVAEFEKLMGLLNARFSAGKIGAEQYRQATEKLFSSTFAADIDKVNKALEYNAETERMVAEHLEETNAAINEQKQAWIDAGTALAKDVATPMEELAARLSYLDELLARKAISWETYARASIEAQDQMDKFKPKVDETSDLFDQLGTTITAAMGGLAEGGKSASDVMKDLAASIIKVVAQVLILEPLIKALKKSMGSTTGGSSSGLGSLVSSASSGIGEWIGSLFKFSGGGVMGPMGPMPLRRYASGGVASSPQLAMFGEGSMPEAYVPLPDGRRIPVAMNGGGRQVIQNITIKTDNPAAVRASRGQMAADFSNQVGRLSRRWG